MTEQEGGKTMSDNLQNEYDNQSGDHTGDGEERPKTLFGSACCYDCVSFEIKLTKTICGCICNNIECCI